MMKKQIFSKTTTKNKNKKKEYLPEELDNALYEMEKYFEQLMCPFMVLGNTLKSIKEKEQVDGNLIELGVSKKQLTEEFISFFKGWGFKFNKNNIKFKIKEVPVEVKIIHKNYPFFKNPDVVWYKITQFQTPNPWRKYWKVRGFIT